MISRHTCSVPKKMLVFPDCSRVIQDAPKLLSCGLRCSQACYQCTQSCLWCTQLLRWLLPELLCSCRDSLQRSQVHLRATASIHSSLGFHHPEILVQQLPNTPSDKIHFADVSHFSFLFSLPNLLYSALFIPTITCWSMSRVLGAVKPLSPTTAFRLAICIYIEWKKSRIHTILQ